MKCAICKLEIREGQKIIQCPSCLAVFHEEHYNEWVKNESACPICGLEIHSESIEIQEITDNTQLNELEKEEQLEKLSFYRNLNSEVITKEEKLQFTKVNKNFDFVFNEKSEGYIIKSYTYYPFQKKSNTGYAIYPGPFLAVILLGMTIFLASYFQNIIGYIALAISVIIFILSFVVVISFSLYNYSLAKEWVFLEFQRELITIFIRNGQTKEVTKEAIALPEIIELEIGMTNGFRKNKACYLTIKTTENNYYLGVIYEDKKEKVIQFIKCLTNFINQNYEKEIITADRSYRKIRRKQKLIQHNFLIIFWVLWIINMLLFWVGIFV